MTEKNSPAARAPRGARARLIMDTATWCYIGGLAVVSWNVWHLGSASLVSWMVALSGPSAGALIYVLVSMLVPSLHAVGRIAFPLTLTLPAVYAACVLLCVVLGTHVGSNILDVPDPVKVTASLASTAVVIECYVAGVALLSLAAYTNSRKEKPAEPEPESTVDSQ